MPVSGKVLTLNNFLALVDSSLDGCLMVGRFTADIEKRLAQFVGTHTALFVNSGSSENLIALSGLKCKALDEHALKPGGKVRNLALYALK